LESVSQLDARSAAGAPTANEATVLFNDSLDVGLDVLPIINFFRGVHIYKLNVYGLFNNIVASPSVYSLANVTTPSQGELVDPDTYLFWDDLHPTTRGHNILALAALKLVDPAVCAAMPAMAGDASCEALPLYGSEAH
jgi:phospholipase/lecithinase/hemolysin